MRRYCRILPRWVVAAVWTARAKRNRRTRRRVQRRSSWSITRRHWAVAGAWTASVSWSVSWPSAGASPPRPRQSTDITDGSECRLFYEWKNLHFCWREGNFIGASWNWKAYHCYLTTVSYLKSKNLNEYDISRQNHVSRKYLPLFLFLVLWKHNLEFSCYAPAVAAAAQILAKDANIFMTSREFYIQKNKTKNKFFSLFSMFVF